jgi:hypothetical protein
MKIKFYSVLILFILFSTLFTSNVEQEIEVIKNENRNIKGIIKTCSG